MRDMLWKIRVYTKQIIMLIAALLSLIGIDSNLVNAEDITITAIKPVIGLRNEIVIIEGSGFGKKDEKSSVEFIDTKNVIYKAEIKEWDDNKISVMVPSGIGNEMVKVRVVTETKSSNEVGFGVYSLDLVDEAINLKKSGVLDSTIVDHLYQLGEGRKGTFGNVHLTSAEIQKLKQAGFQDDFIAKFEGHPQYVTLGIAGIWLYGTHDLVAAPMLRIFLVPRSYFSAQRPYWERVSICGSKSPLYWPKGLLQFDRWDLNFGITNSTSTDASNEQRSYVLAGFSNELNQSALLNLGVAVAPGDVEGKQTQFYMGLTVDYNFLKALGIVSK